MATPEEKDQPVEERIGILIGKIFVLALTTFLVWGYWTAIARRAAGYRSQKRKRVYRR
jgi:hypothetical protein